MRMRASGCLSVCVSQIADLSSTPCGTELEKWKRMNGLIDGCARVMVVKGAWKYHSVSVNISLRTLLPDRHHRKH